MTKTHARELELLGPRPDPDRVDLDAHHAGDDDERALDDLERRDGVGLEARVAWRVDQVDLALPATRGGSARRPATSAACCSSSSQSETVVPASTVPEPVDRAGLEEHRLDERGLARPAVADDGDVADLPGLVGHA